MVVGYADARSNECSDTDLGADDFDEHDGRAEEDRGGGGDDDGDRDFHMPAHIDIVREDLRQLQKQKMEAEGAALARGGYPPPRSSSLL